MQSLNPFLRAFFSSKLPAQCDSPSHYILFFPTTEHLLTHKERETSSDWDDLVAADDILASHVIRVPGGNGPLLTAKDGGPSLRDGKGKAKQFPTLNGRTVVVKDNFIYSNKGFKSLNQAQLVKDFLYYPDQLGAQPWVVIYISKPLVGTPEPLYPTPSSSKQLLEPGTEDASSKKRPDIKGFNDLLNHFPIIARQMQPGLEKLFQLFMREISEENNDRALQNPEAKSPKSPAFVRPSNRRSAGSFSSGTTLEGAQSLKSSLANAGPAEAGLRAALESLVFGAITLFQGVDKHQLSVLSSSTDLSSLALEHMIERYVTEHFHTRVLFPRIKASRLTDDDDLTAAIKYMGDLDISQVGAALDGGQSERRELNLRLVKGVETFKQMGNATCPQEMVDTLLETARAITTATDASQTADKEKTSTVILTNADLLVSMLLIVVVRSPVRLLHARLAYMVGFVFTDEVETGEAGYALSTFEAVLSYLSSHASGLKRASQANRSVRKDARKGNLDGVKRRLDGSIAADEHDASITEDTKALPQLQETVVNWLNSNGSANGHTQQGLPPKSPEVPITPHEDGLGHVFPFQRAPSESEQHRPKLKKRVSLSADIRSRSSSSAHSVTSTTPSAVSRSSTLRSAISYNLKEETSADRLCSSQDSDGNSLLMIAVASSQPRILDYLLDRSDLFSIEAVLDDCNNDGATLLNAAMKIGNSTVIDILVEYLASQTTTQELYQYLGRQDDQGRSAAHYLFNAPHLISRLAPVIPWNLRDKNGQTPLFALCRSYDHDNYINMVEMALYAAREQQGDGEPLHLDQHADAKNNTLLHIANDHRLIRTLLRDCDVDPNIKNEKQYTPLMVASKFARLESVRLLFHDTRTDLQMRESRGFTAVELAKDDDIRNRIDDLILLTHAPGGDGRVTMIVRSYFVEDGTIRMILKSGASNSKDTIMVTTCRRSLSDFETLTKWLALEHPASWIPSISNFRSPFQLPFRPSRVILRDTQMRLDSFLKTMLAHPTFATHEMLWEFFLVPDVDPNLLSQRANLKAATRIDNVKLDYSPIPLDAVSSVELFIDHATDQIRAVHYATQDVLRHINAMRNKSLDLADAHTVMLGRINSLPFVSEAHTTAMKRHAHAMTTQNFASESSPMTALHYQMLDTLSTTGALLTSLSRPETIINDMRAAADEINRQESNAARSAKWPSALGLLDDARRRLLDDSAGKVQKAKSDLDTLGRELAYTQSTVAAELAGWWEMRSGTKPAATRAPGATTRDPAQSTRLDGAVKAGLRDFARGMVIRERERLERLRRAGRLVGVDVFRPRRRGASISMPPPPTPQQQERADDALCDPIADPATASKAGTTAPPAPDAASELAAVDELDASDASDAPDAAAAADAIAEAEADMPAADVVAAAGLAFTDDAGGGLSAAPAEDDEPELTVREASADLASEPLLGASGTRVDWGDEREE